MSSASTLADHRCIACEERQVEQFLNLGSMALANKFLRPGKPLLLRNRNIHCAWAFAIPAGMYS